MAMKKRAISEAFDYAPSQAWETGEAPERTVCEPHLAVAFLRR